MMRPFVTLYILLPLPVLGIQLFAAPGNIPAAVPAKCRAALAQNITCSPVLITGQKAANGDYLMSNDLDLYCSSGCLSSIQTFQKNVLAGCGNETYSLYSNVTSKQFPRNLADGIAWAYNLVCIKDSTGLCIADFYQNKKTDCSDCALKYEAVMLSSDYGRVRIRADQFTALLSSCSVPASKYPWTYTPTQSATTTSVTTTPTSAQTCTGTKYTVKQGDTCESISQVNSVGTDRMIDLNNVDYKCKTLKTGATLCIQDQCTTLVVQKNQTCSSIAKGQPFNVAQIQSWNPSLNSMCDTHMVSNLDAIVGRTICVSPPGGGKVPVITRTTRTGPTLTSSMFSSWTSTDIVTNPADITTSWYYPTFGTDWTASTTSASVDLAAIKHYEDLRKYCWITDEDERHYFDPDELAGACQALVTTYCYPDPSQTVPTAAPKVPTVCTPDRSNYNYTAPPAPVETPLPHQPNMIKGCYKFYKVVANDGCAAVAKANNVVLNDFYKWNPDVGTDCKGLQAGTYVCVAYDAKAVKRWLW